MNNRPITGSLSAWCETDALSQPETAEHEGASQPLPSYEPQKDSIIQNRAIHWSNISTSVQNGTQTILHSSWTG